MTHDRVPSAASSRSDTHAGCRRLAVCAPLPMRFFSCLGAWPHCKHEWNGSVCANVPVWKVVQQSESTLRPLCCQNEEPGVNQLGFCRRCWSTCPRSTASRRIRQVSVDTSCDIRSTSLAITRKIDRAQIAWNVERPAPARGADGLVFLPWNLKKT